MSVFDPGVKMPAYMTTLAGNYLYGTFHQGLPIGTVTALRALLLNLTNVSTIGPMADRKGSVHWHARRAALDTCYRLFLPFCAAACEPEPQPDRGGAAHRPPAPRSGSGARAEQSRHLPRRKPSPQDAYTAGPPRTPWFASTLGVSGRTQSEWRPDLQEWRNCLCLET